MNRKRNGNQNNVMQKTRGSGRMLEALCVVLGGNPLSATASREVPCVPKFRVLAGKTPKNANADPKK